MLLHAGQRWISFPPAPDVVNVLQSRRLLLATQMTTDVSAVQIETVVLLQFTPFLLRQSV
jgi:hypothetical protein